VGLLSQAKFGHRSMVRQKYFAAIYNVMLCGIRISFSVCCFMSICNIPFYIMIPGHRRNKIIITMIIIILLSLTAVVACYLL